MLQALDRWEERLEAIFEGRPYDALDAALTDTVAKFPVDIQPFRWAGFRPSRPRVWVSSEGGGRWERARVPGQVTF